MLIMALLPRRRIAHGSHPSSSHRGTHSTWRRQRHSSQGHSVRVVHKAESCLVQGDAVHFRLESSRGKR